MPVLEISWAFVVALLVLLAALGAGWLGLGLLRINEPNVFSTWLALVVGVGTLSVATLLIGLAGGLRLWLFAPLLVVLAAVGVSALLRCLRARPFRRWLAGLPTDPVSAVGAWLLIGLILSTLVWIAGTHALVPPHEWDEVAYHLELPKLYVAAHQIIYIPYNVTSNWPLNNEMLFTLALLLGSDIAPHLLMLGSTAIILVGLLIVGQHYFNAQVGLVAAGIFVTIPLVKRLAGTSLIDVAPGMFVLAALLTLLRWREGQEVSSKQAASRSVAWLIVCGCLCGFAAGSKLIGGGFALLFGLLVVWIVAHATRLRIGPVVKAGTVFGLAGAVMVGPWYLRSLAFTGNPIWPFAYHTFGGRNWDALGDEYHMHLLIDVWTAKLPRTLVGLFESLYVAVTRPGDLGGYGGGFGNLFALGVIGALVLAWWSPLFVRYTLVISTGFYLLWFAFVSHQLRYLLPIGPLLALAGAYAFDWLYRRVRFRFMQAVVLGVLILLLSRTWPWANEAERGLFVDRTAYARGAVSRDAWLDSQIDVLPLFRYANTQLPANANTLLLPYENRTYYLQGAYFWGHPISQRVIRFEQFDSAAQLAAYLRGMGITHVIDNPLWVYEGLRYWQHDRALMLALRDTCGVTLARHGTAVLYLLHACQ